ncbi:MAG: mechanosensitive ion channel family protein [bacterium]
MNTFYQDLAAHFKKTFDPGALSRFAAEWMMNVIIALMVLLVFFLVWKVGSRSLRAVLSRSRLDKTSVAFIETVVKYGLLMIAVISALNSMGIQMSAVMASLGIAGLTIGFAARDALSNLISGILIFIDRPFVIGDLVEIEGIYGLVDRITLRSTRVITMDGKMMAVPNTEIINKTVASYTNFPHLRLDIPFTVAVTENLNRVRSLVLSLIENQDEFMDRPAARILVTGLNDYNNTLELQVWLKDERQHLEKRAELREKIFNTLTAAGVEMPFQTISLTPVEIKQPDTAPDFIGSKKAENR